MRILYISNIRDISTILVEEARRKNIEAYSLHYPWAISRPTNLFQFFSFMIKHNFLDFDIYHYNCPIATLLPRNQDIKLLKKRDKRVFVHYHGDDIRNKKEKETLRNVNGKIVSTPDLMEFLPDAEWIPFPFNIRGLKKREGWNDTIRILHAPSDRKRKGTAHILGAIKKLKREYDTKFELIEKKPNSFVLERIAISDIVIDQIGPGWYGKVTLEALYHGAVACFYARPDLADLIPIKFFAPIEREKITDRIARLIEDESLRDELRRKGYMYLASYHDAEKIMNRLLELYRW